LFSPFSTAAGEFVEADEIVARIETDKVTVDITSPVAGVIKSYFADEGDTVEVGADFYELDTDAAAGSAAPATPAAPQAAAEAPKAAATPAPVAAAPPKAAPTGPPKPAPPAPKTPSVTAKKAPTGITGTRTETRVPMNRMRIRIADRLKEA